MKRDPDFWFWLSMLVGFLTMFIMSVIYDLDGDSPLFLTVFYGVSLVAIAYLGSTLPTGRPGKVVDATQASAGQSRSAQESRIVRNFISFAWIAGLLGLIWLTSDSLLPWWGRAAPYLVLLVAWSCYQLVSSKIKKIAR